MQTTFLWALCVQNESVNRETARCFHHNLDLRAITSHTAFAFGLETVHEGDIGHGGGQQKQGVEKTIFQTRHRRAQGLGGTPDISFSFLLSHLSKGVHLERVLFQGHGDSLADTR